MKFETLRVLQTQTPGSQHSFIHKTGIHVGKYLVVITVLFFSLMPVIQASEITPGKSFGARQSEKPHWFKESFLEFEEDVAEATASGRRVMIYFHQESCPYCARLVAENFGNPEIEAFVRKHFDGITINMWGDREVVSVGSQDFTEKTFAAALRIQYTPTIIFLDEAGKVALRLNGYYPPEDFRRALDYVAQHMETQISFAEYRAEQQQSTSKQLIHEDFYLAETNLKKIIDQSDKPLVVYFEADDCAECETTHQRILGDKTTRSIVTQLNNVQLGIYSATDITTPKAVRTTASAWAQELGINYTPSLVFFDNEGNEVMRIGAFMKTFHFQSVYAYVLEKAYIEQPSFQRYIASRAENIREQGFDTDIWGYESFHQ